MIMYAGSPTIRFDPPQTSETVAERQLLAQSREERWSLERLEQEHIFSILEHTGGNQTRAADILGIDRRTLYRKLRRYETGD